MPVSSATESLHAFAVELATGAGTLAQRQRAAVLDVGSKSTPTDLVTSADRAVETWLRERIATERPHDAVLGEEAEMRPGSSAVRWVIDPIDGTVNFVLGVPAYAVSVAVERDGDVVAGAVYNPAADELFHAWRVGGAYLGDRRLTGPRGVGLEHSVVGTGFSYRAEVRRRQAEVITGVLPRIADLRRMGSAALDLCSVACGRLDAYFEIGLNPWDRAAGLLVAREAGCAASGLRGRGPDATMTAVAHPRVAPDFFALLEDVGADQVAASA